MGNGVNHIAASDRRIERERISTAILVLVILRQNSPRAMSTYELGLWISDNQNPPRPLSGIIKTLPSAGYILRSASAGKRAGYWTLPHPGPPSFCSPPPKIAN